MQQILWCFATRWFLRAMVSLVIAPLVGPLVIAQDTTEELRKAAQNPVASVVKLPFEQDIFFSSGAYGRIPAQLQAQPVIPFPVTKDWLLVPRIVATVFAYQPDLTRKSGGSIGMGDIIPTMFLTPSKAGKVIWGVGPSVLIPTATSATLGLGKWGIGPSVAVLTQPKWGSLTVLVQNIWSFAGDPKRAAVNQMLLQYNFSYNLLRNWYLTTNPGITADWTHAGATAGWYLSEQELEEH